MKKNYFLFATLFLFGISVHAQTAFTNANTKFVTPAIHSGNAISIVDWNGDGLDDIIQLDQSDHLYIEVQRTNQTYQRLDLLSLGGQNAWAMAVADIDNNGYKDIIYDATGGGIRVVKTMGTSPYILSSTIISFPSLLQNCTFGDFDNDGWVDLFACDDNKRAKLFSNDGGGILASTPDTVIFTVYPGHCNGGCGGHTNDPWDAGNYGSVWVDFDNDHDMDLYIPHCRQGVTDSNDVRRFNRLFVNDGSNNFIVDTVGDAGFYGLTISWETWTSSFGDIDNDGDFDVMLTNHDHAAQILQNNGTGHFTEITSTTNYSIDIPMPMESVMEDFDNDGFNDILAAGDWERFHHNNGDGTFTQVDNLFSTNNMESFAIGDANHDGFIDVYAGYGTIYNNPSTINDVLYLNNMNSNHFITFDLRGTVSNKSAIGARATIFGVWGTQIREVKAGESYGTNNSAMLHFGLGSATVIDSAWIDWPSQIHQTLMTPAADQFVKIIENDCVSPSGVVTASGPLNICPGGSVTFTASPGYTYLWSDNSTAQTLVATASGEYGVVITAAGNNCVATSKTFVVSITTGTPPVISATGTTEICSGGSVAISAPTAASYLWSTGETTQTISATTTGTYSVTVPGACGPIGSNSIAVTVHAPLTPVITSNITLTAPGSTTLNASTTGSNPISWFGVPTGGTALAIGNSYTTPILSSQTIFYASTTESFGGGTFAGGITNSTNGYSTDNTLNYAINFDVLENCTLTSVKVYTDQGGIRKFEVKDASNTVVSSLDYTVPVGVTVVPLNFALTPGTGYKLGTNSTTNNTNLGFNAPRFQRENSGTMVHYPYAISTLLSLTGSAGGTSYYPYYYDWKVTKPATVCESPRAPDTVFYTPSGIAQQLLNSTVSIFPSPTDGKFSMEINTMNENETELSVTDVAGREIIFSHQIELKPGKNLYNFDLSSYADGLYFVNIKNPEGAVTLKVTLQK